MVSTIFYVLRNGISWQAMTQDLPHWPMVYPCFREWQKGGSLEYPVTAIFVLKRPNPKKDRGRGIGRLLAFGFLEVLLS